MMAVIKMGGPHGPLVRRDETEAMLSLDLVKRALNFSSSSLRGLFEFASPTVEVRLHIARRATFGHVVEDRFRAFLSARLERLVAADRGGQRRRGANDPNDLDLALVDVVGKAGEPRPRRGAPSRGALAPRFAACFLEAR